MPKVEEGKGGEGGGGECVRVIMAGLAHRRFLFSNRNVVIPGYFVGCWVFGVVACGQDPNQHNGHTGGKQRGVDFDGTETPRFGCGHMSHFSVSHVKSHEKRSVFGAPL